jgi:hypothetical protein
MVPARRRYGIGPAGHLSCCRFWYARDFTSGCRVLPYGMPCITIWYARALLDEGRVAGDGGGPSCDSRTCRTCAFVIFWVVSL